MKHVAKETGRKRVCFLLGSFQDNGGIGRVTSILVNALSRQAHLDISVITYVQDDTQPLQYQLSDDIHRFVLYHHPISMRKALLSEHAVGRTRALLREQEIDILVACGALFFPLARLATWGTKAACFCWEHTNPSTETDHRFQMQCRRFGIRYADQLIVLTKAAEQAYLTQLHAKREKLAQIYNPMLPLGRPPAYPCDATRIISVGRLSYPKNFSLLIDIAARVLPAHPAWTWDIYGEGEERESLQRKIDTLGLSDRLVLRGQVNDLYQRYQRYGFCVMTSRYEGFPMVLLEALSAGLPLVSFDIPTGPSEIIQDGVNGYLVPPEDADTMAQRLEALMDDAALRQALSAATQGSVQAFQMDAILAQWLALFASTNS